jgi:hypothetical protein
VTALASPAAAPSGPLERLARHLRWHNPHLTVDDLEVTEVPGYWRIKTACGGRGHCASPLHGCLFNEGPVRHTIHFTDPSRDRSGRFASPYRTWRALADNTEAKGPEEAR